MDRSLSVLILGLISMSPLWEGVQCDDPYSLQAPRVVSVQEGLCVFIPCNFTYPKSDPGLDGPLHGYWFETGMGTREAFATNDADKPIVPEARGRFRLSEKVEEGDCSLFITDAQPSDGRVYYFRIEKGDKGNFNFLTNKTSVTVTATPKPEIRIPGQLQAGQPVNVTCTVASCPWNSSQIVWEFSRKISGISSSLSDGTTMSSVVPDFVPTAADNGQPLTCRVTYGSGFANPVNSVQTVQLHVSYPPQRPRISGELRRPKQPPQNLTGLSQVEAREGDFLRLRCQADGNPSPNVTWVGRSPSRGQQSIAGDRLTLDNVTLQDMGGYTCQAQNAMGTSEATFQVDMAQAHRTFPTEIISVSFLLGLSLIKVVFCFLTVSCIFWLSNWRKSPAMGEEVIK